MKTKPAKLPQILTIRVRKSHILSGIPAAAGACPIALAMKEKVRGSVSVACGAIYWALRNGRYYRSSTMPKEAQVFANDFDRGVSVSPFSFRISTTL